MDSIIGLEWEQFRDSLLIGNKYFINCIKTSEYYKLWTDLSGRVIACDLHLVTDAEKVIEFETYYLSNCNPIVKNKVNADGAMIIAPYFPDISNIHKWKTYKFEATAGSTTYFDIEMTRTVKLQGGKYWVINRSDVHEDDYFDFSVVDKNNVLGLFSTYGLVEGDVLELNKFVENEPVIKGEEKIVNASATTTKIYQGLFMRIKYVSYGTTNVRLFITTYSYQM